MQYRKLGNSDLNVSVIGLGTNNFGNPIRISEHADSAAVIHKCLDEGINFIDTSNNYGGGQSEVHIGEALQGRRNEAIVATKFNLTKREGQSIPNRINTAVEESLGKLQTDHIDLYQIHFPGDGISQEEVIEPMNKLVEQGKVRYIGECNYGAWRHSVTNSTAEKKGWPQMVSAQNNYNILRRHVELEIIPYCERFGIAFLPYFPLGGGFLTGKYQPGQEAPAGSRGAEGSGIISKTRNAKNEAVLAKLEAFTAERGHTVLELAFAWLLAHPCIPSVIAGTSSIAQIDGNVAAGDWRLTPEELEEVNQIAIWDGTGEAVDGTAGGVGARAARGAQPQGAR